MGKAKEIHAKKSKVYHNNKKCTERNNIESENIKKGKGGNRLCNTCKRLNSQGK